MMYLPYWDNLDSLTPLQNEWLKKYTRPSIIVIMPQWAMNQPKGFKLDYLLKHAVENGWDLTVDGWAKAHEIGILQGAELTEEVEEEGMKHIEAATRLHEGRFKEKSLASCKTMISRKAANGLLKSNGKTGKMLRIDSDSLDALILKLRDNDLELADDDEKVGD